MGWPTLDKSGEETGKGTVSTYRENGMTRLRYVRKGVRQGYISGKEPICQETGIALLRYVRRGVRQGSISGKEPNCQKKMGTLTLDVRR